MFPTQESVRPDQAPTAEEWAALAVCRRCPLLEVCRDEVIEMELPYGVAGGLTAVQRRKIRADRAHPVAARRAGAVA